MSRRDQTRFVFIGTPPCCVAHKHVVQRRHVSFERPLRQTQNHSDAFCVSANNRLGIVQTLADINHQKGKKKSRQIRNFG